MRYANCVSRLTGCNLGLHVKGDLLNCTCKWQQVREWRTTKMFSWTYYKYRMCLWKFWSGTASDTADRLGDERAKIGPNWRAGLRHRKTAAEAGRGNISNSPHSSRRSTRKATIEVDCGGFVDARTFFSFGFLSSCISGRLHYHARSAIPSVRVCQNRREHVRDQPGCYVSAASTREWGPQGLRVECWVIAKTLLLLIWIVNNC